jgi:hypothetical protein
MTNRFRTIRLGLGATVLIVAAFVAEPASCGWDSKGAATTLSDDRRHASAPV